VVVWSTVPHADFAYTQGEPHRFESTPGHWREFCSNCGTHLVFRPDAGNTLDVASLTLDEPAHATPFFHIWTSSQWPGWAGAEALPRHAQEEP
jgi:ADP-ribosyl-[dinitrogen reductase] hydrolase